MFRIGTVFLVMLFRSIVAILKVFRFVLFLFILKDSLYLDRAVFEHLVAFVLLLLDLCPRAGCWFFIEKRMP